MPELVPSPIDDELLSAYLDDELTPEERARVDERLAADPAARQLLEELRTVSRAMRELPRATLGADLRESVLRRAERAMLVSDGAASEGGKSERFASFPIGRTKRAWFWAGAALAAGLMLMIFDRDPARDGDLPQQVAQGERDSNLARNEPLPPLELRAAQPLADEVAATAEADNEPAIGFGDLAKVTPPTSVGRAAERPLQPAAAPTGGFGGGAGGVAISRSVDGVRSKGIDEGKDLLVVHVNMKPEAMRGRAFDYLLLKNEIEIEEAVEEPSQSPETQDVEVVMVEADPRQLYKCLDEIKKDEANYLGVAVDDQRADSQRMLAEGRPEMDMKQYNRGVVPNQQQVELAPDNHYYFKADQRQSEPKVREGTKFGESQVAQQPPIETRNRYFAQDSSTPSPVAAPAATMSTSSVSEVLSSDSSGQPAGAGAQNDLYLGSKVNVARRAVQQLKTKADTLQVLFVLTCPTEHAAPVATPVSGAEPQEGLKSGE